MRKNDGFTLIELMVVISIIIALIGLLMVSLQMVRNRGNETATRSLLQALETAANQYSTDWGGLNPPAFAPGSSGQTNEGIEMLYIAFNNRTGRSTRYYGDTINNDSVGDLDGDNAYEYIDAWGSPIVYFDSASFAKTCQYMTAEKLQYTATPQKDSKTNRFYKLGKFMLWSIGKNYMNNNGLDGNVSNFQ
jgi:type II secretory pathway pseudopilin PulG